MTEQEKVSEQLMLLTKAVRLRQVMGAFFETLAKFDNIEMGEIKEHARASDLSFTLDGIDYRLTGRF